jgi:hypothetical protein
MKNVSIKIAASIFACAAALPAHAEVQKMTLSPADGAASSIDVMSWSWGASQIVSPRDPASGQATGKRQHKPYTLSKPLPVDGSVQVIVSPRDAASGLPTGRSAGCATGKHFPSVSLRGTSGAWFLTNARIVECTADSVSFNYQKIEWTN